MADPIIAPTVDVGKATPKTEIDFSKLSNEQLGIAEKIVAEAEAQGMDPELALSIAHIENRFTHGRTSPKGAIGVMQLMPGTAEMLKVDATDVDQNIRGGIKFYKQMLDKYQDPHVAAIAYNAGPGVADKFLATDDPSVIPTETLDYVDQLDRLYKPAQAAEEEIPEIVDVEIEKTPGEYEPDKLSRSIGAGAGAATGFGFGQYSDKAIARAEKAEGLTKKPAIAAEKKIVTAEQNLKNKGIEQTGRVKIQTTLAEEAAQNAARLRADALAAEERLAKATENARRFGVIEEVVKTTPGGVTQEGGIGSGAMRHSNIMGEVHEANVVRKGTEAAGPGYSQKSRLIVPDKYASAELYNPEQKAAQAEYAAAQKEHQSITKSLEKAEKAAEDTANRLRNLTVNGPSGLTIAEEKLNAAKQAHAEAQALGKEPGKFTKTIRSISKVPGTYVLPGVAGGFDLAEAYDRYKQGDIPGAVISGIGAAGGALSMVPPVGPIGAGARVLGTGLSLAAPAAQYFRDKGNKAPKGVEFAEGGAVQKFGRGGIFTVVKDFMEQNAKKEAIKASEALGKKEGSNLYVTQSDRTIVKPEENLLGGASFSGLQHLSIPHKEAAAAWGVNNPGTAKTILNSLAKDPNAIVTTFIGHPHQHRSNKTVFDKVMNSFILEAQKGNVSDKIRNDINKRLSEAVNVKTKEPVFDLSEPIDIMDPSFHKQLNTFDRRALAAEVIGGKGIGGKKAQVFDYDKLMHETTDPDLVGAPTGDIGPRLFTLSGETIYRPDLNEAFPHILTGEDLNLHFGAAPRDIIFEKYINDVRANKGRDPGYMDWTRGYMPSVPVTEEMLTKLQKAGYKKGGLAQACSCKHK